MKLVLFGPPGAGKGTFSGQIKKILPNIPHISTGDIFRENLKNQTELGLKAKKYMDAGELVPDEVVIDMVRDRLSKNDVKQHGFLLDGFPRTIEQTKALDEITSIDALILLELDREIIKKRILGRFSCPKCGEIYNKYTLTPKDAIGEDKWKKKHGYGQRWSVETWFSSYKRRFGEHCYSVKKENIVQEVFLKALICNILIK